MKITTLLLFLSLIAASVNATNLVPVMVDLDAGGGSGLVVPETDPVASAAGYATGAAVTSIVNAAIGALPPSSSDTVDPTEQLLLNLRVSALEGTTTNSLQTIVDTYSDVTGVQTNLSTNLVVNYQSIGNVGSKSILSVSNLLSANTFEVVPYSVDQVTGVYGGTAQQVPEFGNWYGRKSVRLNPGMMYMPQNVATKSPVNWSNGLSVSFWVAVDSLTVQVNNLNLLWYGYNGAFTYNLMLTTLGNSVSTVFVGVPNSTNGTTFVGGAANQYAYPPVTGFITETSRWYHVAITHSYTNGLSLYKDGVLVQRVYLGATNRITVWPNQDGVLSFLNFQGTWNYGLTGTKYLDDYGLIERELSSNEVSLLYGLTAPTNMYLRGQQFNQAANVTKVRSVFACQPMTNTLRIGTDVVYRASTDAGTNWTVLVPRIVGNWGTRLMVEATNNLPAGKAFTYDVTVNTNVGYKQNGAAFSLQP